MLKGFGDLIITIVRNIISEILPFMDSQFAIKEYLLDDTSILSNQIQIEVDKLFNTSSLCQYGNQLNSLAELCHKNKLTYTGEGGVSSRTPGSHIRDIHK